MMMVYFYILKKRISKKILMNIFLQKNRKKISFAIIIMCLFLLPTATNAYTINNAYGNYTDCDTMTKGIFIVWWDKDFNYGPTANLMLDSMIAYRTTCVNKLGMQDPMITQNGAYCNIYIHTPGNTADFFSVNYPAWGNGVGGDVNGNAFMTLPNFVLDANYAGGRWRNLAHETFHIFQTRGMWDVTPGIYNTNDSGWFVEAMANWFSYNRYPNEINSFVESEILVRTPHVPLWLAWSNLPSYYPNNWQRQVHQYALSTYLYYLNTKAGVSDSTLASVFYSGTTLTPQEYLFNQLGAANLRNHFIDCAAHMTNGFDFLLPAQHAAAKNEWNTYAALLDNNQYIKTYINTGSNGWVRPADSITTNAWSFNTYKLKNTNTQTYTFEINGDAKGNYGDNAYFQGKLLVQNSFTGSSFYNVNMSNDYQGSLIVNLTPSDTAVFFIIASMPKVFKDTNATFQLFPYEMRISEGNTTASDDVYKYTTPLEIGRMNMLGQKIGKQEIGLQIIYYNNGSCEKVMVK
jgi:Family of unknown function (DUF6055)